MASHFGSKESATRTMSFTSGKGGVGKSTITANVAHKLGEMGKKVLILDGDMSMANLDIMYRVKPKYTLEHVIRNERRLSETVVSVSRNIDLIPGGSGVYEMQHLDLAGRASIVNQIDELEKKYDYMLIDTAPGIDENVLYLNSAAQEICLVVTPDPASLTDSYALIKVLHQRKKENKFSIVCNQVRDEEEAKAIFNRLYDVSSRFLSVRLEYQGYIPTDVNVKKATKTQQLFSQSYPRSPSSFALGSMVKNMSCSNELPEFKGGIQFFWNQLVGVA